MGIPAFRRVLASQSATGDTGEIVLPDLLDGNLGGGNKLRE